MRGGAGDEGEGGAEIKAHPKREISGSGVGLLQPSDLRAARASPEIRLRLRRGPGRPEPSPGSRPALPRRAYLVHGCLPLGPVFGHRLMPRGTGHSRPGGIARSCRSPTPAPGLRERAGSTGPAGLGGLTPSALRMRERPVPAPPAGQEDKAPLRVSPGKAGEAQAPQ